MKFKNLMIKKVINLHKNNPPLNLAYIKYNICYKASYPDYKNLN